MEILMSPYECSSRERRRTMSDDEFWADVYGDPLSVAQELDECFGIDAVPCPECGSAGACGYDSLGRPMIHAVTDDDEVSQFDNDRHETGGQLHIRHIEADAYNPWAR